MNSFDGQVYNLKEAIWHKRGKRLSYLFPEQAAEAERIKKIERHKRNIETMDQPSEFFMNALTWLCVGGGIIALLLWL